MTALEQFMNIPIKKNLQFFFASNTRSVGSFSERLQVWTKPTGVNYVHILALGGGGGGGAGCGRTTAVGVCGGAGGSACTPTYAVFPAYTLPDTLYVSVGTGSAGGLGVNNGNGGNAVAYGSDSLVTLATSTSIVNTNGYAAAIVVSYGGQGGTGGNTSTGGTFGQSSGAWSPLSYDSLWASLGIFNSQAGGNGTAGGTTSGAASSVTFNRIVSGGAGGGGISLGSTLYNAGSISAAGNFPINPAGASLTANSSVDGNPGNTLLFNFPNRDGFSSSNKPMQFYGGSGGGAVLINGSYSCRGGRGGDGAYGCGGGGGGPVQGTSPAATLAAGGDGGKGGDGLVIISCT